MGYTLFVKLHNSWPAIHRVLLAAREAAFLNMADNWIGELDGLREALRALDGDKGAT